jgi:hypothetical protein
MKVVVRFTAKQEAKALPIIVRQAPGMILPNRTYVLAEEVVQHLRDQGIKFTEISREGEAPSVGGAVAGERV